MNKLCTWLSMAVVVLTASGLAGCYDLSDPTGPHRDDFARDTKGTPAEPAHENESQQEKTVADTRCPTSPCNAADQTEVRLEAVQTRDAKVPSAMTDQERVEDARRKLRVPSNDGDSSD